MDTHGERLTSSAPVSRRSVRPLPVAAVALPLVLVLGSVLGACGGQDEEPDPAPTQAAAPAPPPAPPAEDLSSQVTDRRYDVGTVVDVRERPEGGTVLVLDRWTVVGLDDAALAEQGYAVAPHTDDRFANQNDESTYRVPVAADALVVRNECVAPAVADQPPGLRSGQIPLDEFLEGPDRAESVVVLEYSGGELVRLDTDPRC